MVKSQDMSKYSHDFLEAFESPPRGVTCGSTPGGLQAKTALNSATLETRAFRVCFVRVHHQLL